ncbi:MAG: 30S ribosomal protein S18 [Patescibacteria group bacterium]
MNQRKTNQSANPKPEKRYCFFCVNGIEAIDYKNTNLLRRFISSYSKIVPRKRSGVCSKHQRNLAQAIKRARIMALLPFVTK